jgi:hypothetical protein
MSAILPPVLSSLGIVHHSWWFCLIFCKLSARSLFFKVIRRFLYAFYKLRECVFSTFWHVIGMFAVKGSTIAGKASKYHLLLLKSSIALLKINLFAKSIQYGISG